MKALLMGLIFITCTASLAQSWEDEACTSTFYQPGGTSVVEAAQNFSIEIVGFACALREVIQVGPNENMYILSYNAEAGEMKYLIYDFTAQHETGELIAPTEKICTVRMQYVAADSEPAEDGTYSLATKLEITEPSCIVRK